MGQLIQLYLVLFVLGSLIADPAGSAWLLVGTSRGNLSLFDTAYHLI